MAEVKILRYKSNVQFALKNFASFVLILQLVLEFFDLKLFLYVFETPSKKVVETLAPVYLLKLQPAVIISYCVLAGLYGIFKKKRDFLTPCIAFQFLILVKVTTAYILCVLFVDYGSLRPGTPSWVLLIHVNLYTVLAKLQWSIAIGHIIQFGLGVCFLVVIICCYVVIGPEETNEKDKLAVENNVFDYQSSSCFCCSRYWLRTATFFILLYRLFIANLEIFSDFLCYGGFQSFKPGWMMLPDIFVMYFIIEQVATLVALYGLLVTELKVLKCYVTFLLVDLLKQTITFIYPMLLELSDRSLEPLNVTKVFINGHEFLGSFVYLFLASCFIVIIYGYVRKFERNPIIVETFEMIGLAYRNMPKITP